MKTRGNDTVDTVIVGDVQEEKGLTKRKYFAVLAMQGLQASNFDNDVQTVFNYKDIASMSVKQADALIAELNKSTGEKT